MAWSRSRSELEAQMVDVLERAQTALTIGRIVELIQQSKPGTFGGRTPANSLYSVVYKRERRRRERGQRPLFRTRMEGREVVYELAQRGDEGTLRMLGAGG